jgi:hypothetical protein
MPQALQEMQSPLSATQDMGIAPQQGAQPQAGMDIKQLAQMLAQQYVQLGPQEQQMAMQNLMNQNPELAQLVKQYVAQLQLQPGGGQPQPANAGVDMRPMPDKLPPRRDSAMV